MNDTTVQQGTFESRDLFLKAEKLIKKNDYRGASNLLHDALRISPDNPVYLSYLGVCVGMLGDPDSGERTCRKALLMGVQDPILYVNLGRMLVRRGQRQGARDAFIRAYRMDNTNPAAALELARLGVRRKPVIGFLDRSHPLNIWLGKLRYRLVERLHSGKLKR